MDFRNETKPLTNLLAFSGYGVLMAVLGTIGNSLSLAVALRPKLRGNSFSVFLVTLAIADTMVLWAQAFLLLTYHRVSGPFCATRPFFLMYPEAQANWIIAGLTIERFLMISFPIQSTAIGMGKLKSGLIIVTTIVLVILAFHIPTLFFLKYDGIEACTGRQNLAYVSGKIYPWLTVISFFYLPMLMIVVCNVGIVRKLLTAATSGSGTTASQQRLRRVTITVSVVSAVYVGLETCNTLIRTVVAVGDIDALNPPPSFFGSMMACQTNHGINIFLYLLSGDQFREEFLHLLRALCCLSAEKPSTTTKSSSEGTATTAT